MNNCIAGEYSTDGSQQNGCRGNVDTVEQVLWEGVDLFKNVGVVIEVKLSRPEISSHRIRHGLDRQQQHPGQWQQNRQHKKDDQCVSNNIGERECLFHQLPRATVAIASINLVNGRCRSAK